MSACLASDASSSAAPGEERSKAWTSTRGPVTGIGTTSTASTRSMEGREARLAVTFRPRLPAAPVTTTVLMADHDSATERDLHHREPPGRKAANGRRDPGEG